MKNKATHFGAGNIGRGFIGEVLSKNKYHINFIDNNESVIKTLNEIDSYDISFIGTNSKYKVTSFSGISAKDESKVIESLLDSEVITISVGAVNLNFLVNTFNKYLSMKAKNSAMVQNIICAENGVSVSTQFKKMLTIPSALEKVVSFVDAAVDRIVPIQEGNDIRNVDVEEFYEMALDESLWLGEKKLEGVDYYKDVLPVIKRKLFMLNGVHALIAWSGFQKYKYIHEYVDYKSARELVDSYLEYLCEILIKSDGWEKDVISKYKEKIESRVQNKALNDDIERVGRNVISKLAWDERIVQPLITGYKLRLDIEPGIRALLKGYSVMSGFEDKQYLELREYVKSKGLRESISHFSSIKEKNLLDQIISLKIT